ncbi:MAG: hypothetical protein ACFCUQ_15745 [Kiloniellales bacterium]
MLYGALAPRDSECAIEFFVTERSLAPGAYILGADQQTANVFIAESVAALIMQIQPVIEWIEREGQQSLGFEAMDPEHRLRLADQLANGLVRRLSEDSAAWQEEPDWLDRLRPAPE